MEYERFGEPQLMRDPRPEESANEAERGRDEQPAPASAGKRSADGAADRCDHDKNDESRNCQCHDFTLMQMTLRPNVSNDGNDPVGSVVDVDQIATREVASIVRRHCRQATAKGRGNRCEAFLQAGRKLSTLAKL